MLVEGKACRFDRQLLLTVGDRYLWLLSKCGGDPPGNHRVSSVGSAEVRLPVAKSKRPSGRAVSEVLNDRPH